jgi:MFS superfamily sulfate permease-like transporter
MVALFGVLLFDTLPGLVLGIVVSLFLLLYRVSRPHVAELGRIAEGSTQFADRDRHPENLVDPGVSILRVEAGLFFANADSVRQVVKAHAAVPGTTAVVIDAESIPFIDVTAVRMLDELADDLARTGQRLVIAHDLGQVGDLLGRFPDTDLGVYPTIVDALASVTGSGSTED